MSSVDKNLDEAEFKKAYKEIILSYLPREWLDSKVDDFIEKLFKGLLYDPKSEFGRAINRIIYRMRKKWLFLPLFVYDDYLRPIGVKYFPNTTIKPKTKETV